MASVSLTVGGRSYDLACRDGEEARLHLLAAEVDARLAVATRMLGPATEARRLLLAALLLADALADARAAAAPPATPGDDLDGLAAALDQLAHRLEKLGDALEPAAATP